MSAFDVNQLILRQRLKKRLDELREQQKKIEEQPNTEIKDKDKSKEQKPKSLRLAKRRYWQRVGRLSAFR